MVLTTKWHLISVAPQFREHMVWYCTEYMRRREYITNNNNNNNNNNNSLYSSSDCTLSSCTTRHNTCRCILYYKKSFYRAGVQVNSLFSLSTLDYTVSTCLGCSPGRGLVEIPTSVFTAVMNTTKVFTCKKRTKVANYHHTASSLKIIWFKAILFRYSHGTTKT